MHDTAIACAHPRHGGSCEGTGVIRARPAWRLGVLCADAFIHVTTVSERCSPQLGLGFPRCVPHRMEAFFRGAGAIDDVGDDDLEDVHHGFVKTMGTSLGGDLFIADARGGLRSVRLREELLYGSFARDAVERGLEPVSERTTLRLPPGAAPFRVTLAVPSPSGVLVALCGYSSPDNCACVRVLDLSRTDLARRTEVNSRPRLVTETLKGVTDIGQGFFGHAPGLRVLQADWHPQSAHHLVILTSGGTLLMFDALHAPNEPELALRLEIPPPGAPVGASLGLTPPSRAGAVSRPSPGSRARGQRSQSRTPGTPRHSLAAAFAFAAPSGAGAAPWARFTVLVLCRDGRVFAVCPVCPGGAPLTPADVDGMRESLAEAGDALHAAEGSGPDVVREGLAWLGDALAEEGGRVCVLPGRAAPYVPCLQGPLDVLQSFDGQETSNSEAPWEAAVVLQHHLCTAVVLASKAAVTTHVLAGECLPAFRACPQRSPGPLTAPSPTSLMLIDTVSLAIEVPTRGDALGMPLGGSDPDDDGVDVAAGESWGVVLMPDRAMASRVFVAHPNGVHSVTLPWMPVVSSYLTRVARAEAAPGSAPPPSLSALPEPSIEELCADPDLRVVASVGSELTGSAVLALDDDLRPACLRPAVAWAADEAACLSPRGPSAARGSLAAPSVSRDTPPRASPAGDGTAGERGAASPGARGREVSLSPLARAGARKSTERKSRGGGPGLLSKGREDELLTAVALRYKDVLQGPPAPSDMPDIPADLDSDSVDGRKALVEAATALKKSFVAFAGHAEALLTERFAQMAASARECAAKVEELQPRAEEAGAVQSALADRFTAAEVEAGRLSARLDALVEEVAGLPHVPSDEQRRFGALLDRHEDTTLPDLEALAKRLRHQAAELHRAAMLVRRRGQRGHSADPGSAADGDAGGAGGAASMSLRFSSGVVRRMEPVVGRAMLTGLGAGSRAASALAPAASLSRREEAAVRQAAQAQGRLWVCQALASGVGDLAGEFGGFLPDSDAASVASDVSIAGRIGGLAVGR